MIHEQGDSPQLPKGWVGAKLEQCVDILDGRRVPVNADTRQERQGVIPYYGATGQVGWIDDHLFDEELVLLGEDGAPFGDPFKSKAYIIRGKSWVNNHAHVLRAVQAITTNSFLCLYLNLFRYDGYVSGTTRLKLNQAPMRKIPVPLPPLPEQRRIVAKIEELFTRLDAGVEALNKIKLQLKRYRQSVLKAAFEGKLTAKWREAHKGELEPASVLLEGIREERKKKLGSKYKELPPPNTSGLPELHQGWSYTGLRPLLSISREGVKTGPFGSLLKKYEHKAKGVPVIGIENIGVMRYIRGSKIHITEEKANQLSGYDALPGDAVISRSGTVGQVCVMPSDIGEVRISTNLMRVSLASGGMLPQFFGMLFVGSPFILSQVSDLCKGSTRPFLNRDILFSLTFPLPPIAEQVHILNNVEHHFSIADAVEQAVDANLTRAQRLRQSILKRAFEGKLVPQDPNDEPAEKLLERIKAERAKPPHATRGTHGVRKQPTVARDN